VANANPEVVEKERKKQADAEIKMKTLRENAAKLNNINKE
jgi:valyl-tRNA synthetase